MIIRTLNTIIRTLMTIIRTFYTIVRSLKTTNSRFGFDKDTAGMLGLTRPRPTQRTS